MKKYLLILSAVCLTLLCCEKFEPYGKTALNLLRIAGEDVVVMPEYCVSSNISGGVYIGDWNARRVSRIEMNTAATNCIGIIECEYVPDTTFPYTVTLTYAGNQSDVVMVNDVSNGAHSCLMLDDGKLFRTIYAPAYGNYIAYYQLFELDAHTTNMYEISKKETWSYWRLGTRRFQLTPDNPYPWFPGPSPSEIYTNVNYRRTPVVLADRQTLYLVGTKTGRNKYSYARVDALPSPLPRRYIVDDITSANGRIFSRVISLHARKQKTEFTYYYFY